MAFKEREQQSKIWVFCSILLFSGYGNLPEPKPAFIQFISADANFSAHETNARLIVFNHTQFSTVFFQLREHLIRLFS